MGSKDYMRIENIKKAYESGAKEFSAEAVYSLLEEIEKHKQYIKQFELRGRKGKSSVAYKIRGEALEIVTYQKIQGEVNKVITKVYREEMEAIIQAIHNSGTHTITKKIAEEVFKILGITQNHKAKPMFEDGRFIWDNLFTWRAWHNKLTRALDVLREMHAIDYSGGKVIILNKDRLKYELI